MATTMANTAAANRARVASSKNTPMPATNDEVMAQMAAMQAQMAQLMMVVQQKDAQIAELIKAAPAPKAERPPVTAQNCTWTHDAKKGTVTIVVDLNADIIDPATNAPKISKNGEGKTTAVANLFGKLPDKTGRMVGFSLNAYHKFAK